MKNNTDLISQIVFKKVEDDIHTLDYADVLLSGRPLCLDFTDCPQNQANQMLAFLSGVNYATDGDYKLLKNKIFIFALKEHFREQALKEFIKQYGEKNNAK